MFIGTKTLLVLAVAGLSLESFRLSAKVFSSDSPPASCPANSNGGVYCFFRPQWICFADDGTIVPQYSFRDVTSSGCLF